MIAFVGIFGVKWSIQLGCMLLNRGGILTNNNFLIKFISLVVYSLAIVEFIFYNGFIFDNSFQVSTLLLFFSKKARVVNSFYLFISFGGYICSLLYFLEIIWTSTYIINHTSFNNTLVLKKKGSSNLAKIKNAVSSTIGSSTTNDVNDKPSKNKVLKFDAAATYNLMIINPAIVRLLFSEINFNKVNQAPKTPSTSILYGSLIFHVKVIFFMNLIPGS